MVYENIKDLMAGICNAVREKEGSTDLIPHQKLPERISNIRVEKGDEVTYEARYRLKTISTSGMDASIRVENLLTGKSDDILYTSVTGSKYINYGEFKVSYGGESVGWVLTCNTNMLLVDSFVILHSEKISWKYDESIEYDVKVRVLQEDSSSIVIPSDPYRYIITTKSVSGSEASLTVEDIQEGTKTDIPYKSVENGVYQDFEIFRISYSAKGWCLTCTTDKLYINGNIVLSNGESKSWFYYMGIEYKVSLTAPNNLIIYNKGDECTSITGGWDSTFTVEKWSDVNGDSLTTRPVVKNIDNVFINPTDTHSIYPMNTVKKIDLTLYNTFYIELEVTNRPYHIGLQIVSNLEGNYALNEAYIDGKYVLNKGIMPDHCVKNFSIAHRGDGSYLTKHYIDIEDISDISGEYYIVLYDFIGSPSTDTIGETYIKRIWLT